MAGKLLLSLAAAALSLLLAEGAVRLWQGQEDRSLLRLPPAALLQKLPDLPLDNRERDNQMIGQNVALFAAYPQPAEVTSAFIGTSRSKVLRPDWYGLNGAINASGNFYNEITYGLLLQAEALRLQFPNLKTVYIETSLLLRRPDRLIVEADHRKYLPLLESLLPLRDQLPDGARFRREVEAAVATSEAPSWRQSQLLQHRADLRLSNLFHSESEALTVRTDPFLKSLKANGERKDPAGPAPDANKQVPSIAADNVKVTRMRDIAANAPWDHLFEMIALWGRANSVKIVFYQPPVRSDLYQYQQQSGLAVHVADLEKISATYDVPFIDLNRPDLHYADSWDLFADEDHLETCRGTVLLQIAILEGARRFDAGLKPIALTRTDAEKKSATQLKKCETDAR